LVVQLRDFIQKGLQTKSTQHQHYITQANLDVIRENFNDCGEMVKVLARNTTTAADGKLSIHQGDSVKHRPNGVYWKLPKACWQVLMATINEAEVSKGGNMPPLRVRVR
jgi:hypothetical protein